MGINNESKRGVREALERFILEISKEGEERPKEYITDMREHHKEFYEKVIYEKILLKRIYKENDFFLVDIFTMDLEIANMPSKKKEVIDIFDNLSRNVVHVKDGHIPIFAGVYAKSLQSPEEFKMILKFNPSFIDFIKQK